MSLPTLVYVLPALLCALSWLALGFLVPSRWLHGTPPLLAGLTRIATGAAVLALALYGLGRLGLLAPAPIAVATVLLGAAGVPAAVALSSGMGLPRGGGRLAGALLALTAAALALYVVAASAPPTSGDALMYHLALPELWLEQGAIDDPFWRWEAFNPFAVQMLFAQGLALAGGETAAVLHALAAVGCALGIFGLARELGAGSTLAGAGGAALFTLQGLVTWEATSAFVDLGMTFFVVLAVWHGVRYAAGAGASAAAWAGLLSGAAAGTKYVGALAGGLVLVAVLALALVRRAGSAAALAGCLALAVAGPWYVKNLLVTGNPVYPLLFGGRLWPGDPPTDEHYGIGASLFRLPLLPLDLIVHGDAFDRGRHVGTALFVLAPAALLARARTTPAVLLALTVVYLGAWSQLSPQARFLLPALAVLAALGGVGAERLAAHGRWSRAAAVGVLCAAAVAWAVSSAALTRQLLPVALGLEERSAFLERLTGTHVAYHAVALEVPGTLATAGHEFTFTYPGSAIQLDRAEFGQHLSAEEFARRLRSHGVTHVLVREPLHARGEVAPIGDCLEPAGSFGARFVASRARSESEPMELGLYDVRRCLLALRAGGAAVRTW